MKTIEKRNFEVLNRIRNDNDLWGRLNLSEKNWIDDISNLTSLRFEQVIELWRIRNFLDI